MPAGLCVTGAGFESWTHPDLLCAFGVPLGYGFTCRTGLRRMDCVSLASEELMGREHFDEGVGWGCPEALAREAQEPRLDSQVLYPLLSSPVQELEQPGPPWGTYRWGVGGSETTFSWETS